MSEYPSYLIHYGIEGQKWGVRRFQNEDGTYTDEGLLRRKDQKYFVKEQRKIIEMNDMAYLNVLNVENLLNRKFQEYLVVLVLDVDVLKEKILQE